MTHDYYKADIDIVIILGRRQKKEIDVIYALVFITGTVWLCRQFSPRF